MKSAGVVVTRESVRLPPRSVARLVFSGAVSVLRIMVSNGCIESTVARFHRPSRVVEIENESLDPVTVDLLLLKPKTCRKLYTDIRGA